MSQPDLYRNLVTDAKTRIREVTVADLSQAPLDPQTVVIDVREAEEWAKGHVVGAIHLSRGVIESEIEEKVPNLNTPILCYCARGNRSALVADNLQKMGYTQVTSLAGGFREWAKARLPITPGGAGKMI